MIISPQNRASYTFSSHCRIFRQAKALLFYVFFAASYCAADIPVQLASVYNKGIDVNAFLVSAHP
jgi:hypothetical protein